MKKILSILLGMLMLIILLLVLRLYQDMGTALKHQFSGATAWIISSNEEALKCVGLRPAKKIHLVNGDLECLFNKYELFRGDRKTWKKSL